MNDQFNVVLNNVKQALNEEPIVKEYFILKRQVQDNPEIANLLSDMRKWQKEMSVHMNDDAIYFPAKDEYERIVKKYNSHPLIQNFKIIQAEVNELLNQIKTIIE